MITVFKRGSGRWYLLAIRLDMIYEGRKPKQYGPLSDFVRIQQTIDAMFQRGYFWVTEQTFWDAIDILQAEEQGYGDNG